MKHLALFKNYWLFFLISLLVILPGTVSLFKYKLRPSIDFTGGTLWEIKVSSSESVVSTDQLREELEKHVSVTSIQQTNQGTLIVRSAEISPEKKQEIGTSLQPLFSSIEELRFETVGPILGKELLVKTVIAIFIVSIIITLFLLRQFSELKYGIAAILAMFHDTLVLLGAFSILGFWKGVEVDVLFVTAVLTTLSFSVHDTIVVFDRIRELRRKHPKVSLAELASTAALQTVGRSINNSLTIILMLTTLVLLGGDTLKWFAVALLIGSITGTYSSTFTAIPLMLLWEDVQLKLKNRKEKRELHKKVQNKVKK